MLFPSDLQLVSQNDALFKLGVSALALLLIYTLRWGVLRAIRGSGSPLTDRQRWGMRTTRNVGGGLVVLTLVLIWSDELAEFALSLAAVAVAIVIATKELILCIAGAIWRAATPAVAMGDWIEIGPHSGEVIDETLFATVLQEIDPEDFHVTGRVIAVPNSLLLTQPVVNHGFRKRFTYLDYTIYSPPRADAETVRARIQTALDEAGTAFHDLARRYASRIEATTGARLREPEAKVTLATTDLGNLVFHCRLFAPRDQACTLRAAAMRAFLADAPEAG